MRDRGGPLPARGHGPASVRQAAKAKSDVLLATPGTAHVQVYVSSTWLPDEVGCLTGAWTSPAAMVSAPEIGGNQGLGRTGGWGGRSRSAAKRETVSRPDELLVAFPNRQKGAEAYLSPESTASTTNSRGFSAVQRPGRARSTQAVGGLRVC